MARFKTKKKKIFKLRYLLLIPVIFITYDFTFNVLTKTNIKISDTNFIKYMLSEGNHNLIYKYNTKTIFSKALKFLSNVDFTNPITLLPSTSQTKTVSHTDEYNYNELKELTDFLNDPNPSDVSKPVVYIYNSHQLENYNSNNLDIYNIKPNVLMGAYMLKEKLNNLGIPTIVESSNLSEFMTINNWEYYESYKASRIHILDNKNKYPTLKYFIDFHRDSVKYDLTTKTIDGKKYARLLFVVGLENKNYEKNLATANKLNAIFNKKYPGLSKGILKKEGAGVDGVYNQDIDSNIMLLEFGGVDNNIEEVLNSIEAVSLCLYELINE